MLQEVKKGLRGFHERFRRPQRGPLKGVQRGARGISRDLSRVSRGHSRFRGFLEV